MDFEMFQRLIRFFFSYLINFLYPAKIDKNKIRKILVVELSHIGDSLLTLPLIHELKRKYKNAKIDYFCKKNFAVFFRENPNINKVITKKEDIKWDYDLVVDINSRIWFLFQAVLLRSKYRKEIGGVFLKNFLHGKKEHNILTKLSVVGGKKVGGFRPYFKNKKKEWVVLRKFFVKKPYVVICPGAVGKHKLWKNSEWIKVIKKLKRKFHVYLIGAEKEKRQLKELTRAFSRDKKVHNIIGKTSVEDLIYLIKNCSFFVGVDSGPGHIAALFRKKEFILIGHSDWRKWRPWNKNAVIFTKPHKKTRAEEVLREIEGK